MINITGIILFCVSVFLRRQFYTLKKYSTKNMIKFYTAIYAMIGSMVLGYGSVFLVPYVIVIGLPLVYLHILYEKHRFKDYENIINSAKSYHNLQQKYFTLVNEHQAQDKKRG